MEKNSTTPASLSFRAFQEADRPALEQIIRETWNYDRFCTQKTAAQLAGIYLHSCLANQTFTQVALLDSVPVGIIMAKNRRTHRCPLSLRLKMLRAVLSLLLRKDARSASKLFARVEKIDQALLRQCSTDYQGELTFFAVSKHCRGKGLGKALFEKATAYLQAEKISACYLFTDTSCNYRFYEHQGLHRQQEQKQSFQINGQTEEMTFFLYDFHC